MMKSSSTTTVTSMNDVSPVLYQRIAALEAQVAFLYQHLQIAAPPAAQIAQTGIPHEIADLARSGDVIGAIKLHRQMFGSSLAEAKDIVDRLR